MARSAKRVTVRDAERTTVVRVWIATQNQDTPEKLKRSGSAYAVRPVPHVHLLRWLEFLGRRVRMPQPADEYTNAGAEHRRKERQ